MTRVDKVHCWIGVLDEFKILGEEDEDATPGTTLWGNMTKWSVDCGVEQNNTCTSPGLAEWSQLSKRPSNVAELSNFLNQGATLLISHLENNIFRKELASALRNSSIGCGYDDKEMHASSSQTSARMSTRRQLKQHRRLNNNPVPFNQWTPPGWAPPYCPWDKGIAIFYGSVCGILLATFVAWFFIRCSYLEQDRGRCKCEKCCCNCRRCCTILSTSSVCRPLMSSATRASSMEIASLFQDDRHMPLLGVASEGGGSGGDSGSGDRGARSFAIGQHQIDTYHQSRLVLSQADAPADAPQMLPQMLPRMLPQMLPRMLPRMLPLWCIIVPSHDSYDGVSSSSS